MKMLLTGMAIMYFGINLIILTTLFFLQKDNKQFEKGDRLLVIRNLIILFFLGLPGTLYSLIEDNF